MIALAASVGQHARMGRTARGIVGWSALLFFVGCTTNAIDEVPLDVPAGAGSGVVALAGATDLQVVAFDVESPLDLPYLEDHERFGAIRIFARYYKEDLGALGMEAGPLPAWVDEETFGTIPRSTSFPQDQWLNLEGDAIDEEWTRGEPIPPFSTFISSRLPIDRQACQDLEVIETFVLDSGSNPSRTAGIGPGLALVHYGSGRGERIYVVRDSGGSWTSETIDPRHFLARMVTDRGSISFVAGDGQGGVLVGDCERAPDQTYTSTIWRSPSFDEPFAPLYVEEAAPQCPAELLPLGDGQWILRRHAGSLAWLERSGARLRGINLEMGRAPGGLAVRGNEVFALDGSTVHLYRAGAFSSSSLVPIADDERIRSLLVAGQQVIVSAPKIESGLGNEFYRRNEDGSWSALASISAQEANRVISLFDTVLMTVTFGQALQFSPRDGLCPEQTDAITGIYAQHHLVALEPQTFLVAGYASSSDFSAPARVAILRARLMPP